LLYILLDFLSGAAAYTALHVVRKRIIEPSRFGIELPLAFNQKFWLAILVTAIIYVVISALGGTYRDLTRKSRLKQTINTFSGTLLTALILFFLIFLDDYIKSYNQYYLTLGTYTLTLFVFSAFFRFVLATYVRKQLDAKKLSFKSILVGSGKDAGDLLQSFQQERTKGYDIIGYMKVNGDAVDSRINQIPYLGNTNQIRDVANDNQIEDIVIALSSGNSEAIAKIVSDLEDLQLRIHVLPNLFSILSGHVKMESFGRSMIEVKRDLVPPHVVVIKRLFDILISIASLLLLSPIILLGAVGVKATSKGPIFFRQNRLGKNGKSFKIIKLRSMVLDAEKLGPQLSKEDDPRITSWGRTMRKYRIDELPQFYNVLMGDMAIVGPRPERKFYFEQIIAEAPQYKFLLRVKPGITSWGMVKYGYAENVEEMLERARFDLIYTENITLLSDIKILFYTLVTVLQGRGK
jgi:exopolysaccharide biosynthesis polyprenyl glycosylphosphotransferase